MALSAAASVYAGMGGMSPSAGEIYGNTNLAAQLTGKRREDITGAEINAVSQAAKNYYGGSFSGYKPSKPKGPSGPSNSGSRGRVSYSYSRGGGGGGGGGGKPTPPPTYNQAQMDWLARLLAGSRPGQVTATTLDLPDYNSQFDPTMYNQLEGNFNTAVGLDRKTASQAYANLNQNLRQNYVNAFRNPNVTYQRQAPGMSASDMRGLMLSQGASPSLAAEQAQGTAAGNAAFGNLWKILGANEQTAQANRLRRTHTDANMTQRALDVAALQGRTGIGLQRSKAQADWQQRVDEMRQQIAQQEAMANWQRQNEVADLNASNRNSYINAQMGALLQLLPEFKGTASPLPNLDTILGAW